MTRDQLDLLQEARDSIGAARLLLQSGRPKYAASRAYYAMFYIAEALLEGKGLSFSKHSAVIAAFGREFAATGQMPQEFHRYLIDGQDLRQLGDYGPRDSVEADQARELIERAEQFPALAEKMVGPLPGE